MERICIATLRRLIAGADVVIEHVGGRMFEAGVAALARNGRLVTCGATVGAKVALDPETVSDTIGVLLKYQDDIARIEQGEGRRLLNEVKAELAAAE